MVGKCLPSGASTSLPHRARIVTAAGAGPSVDEGAGPGRGTGAQNGRSLPASSSTTSPASLSAAGRTRSSTFAVAMIGTSPSLLLTACVPRRSGESNATLQAADDPASTETFLGAPVHEHLFSDFSERAAGYR